MGQGRNSRYLAEQGWEVTGFDIADEGVRIAREEASRRNLKLNAVVADVDDFDYAEQWSAGTWSSECTCTIWSRGMLRRS